MGREAMIMLAWLAGGAFAIAMLWGMCWALFAGRSRGERRCPRCWHTIDDGRGPCPTLRCGECGHWASREADLLRTRRRWTLAGLCVLALLIGTLGLRHHIVQSGWWTLLPDRALVWISPWLGDSQDGLMARGHLRARLMSRELDPQSLVAMLQRAREGDASSPIGSESWRRRYGTWLEPLRGAFWSSPLATPAVRQAAASVPPVVQVALPAWWKAGSPVFARTSIEDCLPGDVGLQLQVADVEGLPLQPGALQALQCNRWTRRGGDRLRGEFCIGLGPLPAGTHAGSIVWHWRALGPQDSVIASGTSRSPVQLLVRDEVAAPVPTDDETATEAVRQAFTPALLLRNAGRSPSFAFSYRPNATSDPALRDVVFGLVVEACERGVPRRTLRLWWQSGRADLAGNEPAIEDVARLLQAQESPDWTLRVHGDAELAARAAAILDVDAPPSPELPATPVPRFWSGSFEVPLTIQDLAPETPARAWLLERVERQPAGSDSRQR